MDSSHFRSNISAASELFQEVTKQVEKTLRDSAETALHEGRVDEAESLIQKLNDVRALVGPIRVCERKLLTALALETDEQATGAKLTAESHQVPREPDVREMSYNGTLALAVMKPSGCQLRKGSTVRRTKHPSLPRPWRRLREKCEADGTLVPDADAELFTLTKDLEFPSPSAAAQFVAGCSVSGTREWRNRRGA
jgi:hypothetical protein